MIRLETKQVSKSFDGKKVIEDISISLQKNEIVSLLGVSGAGKTTLFNVISGLMEPDSGEVLLKWERDYRPGGTYQLYAAERFASSI